MLSQIHVPKASAVALALGIAMAVTAPAAVLGETFDVISTADSPDAQIDGTCATADAPPVCTLRAAIQEANATPIGDIINLPAGKYVLKRVGAGDDAASTGDLDVTSDLTLNGATAKTTIVSGKKDRVFQVFPGVTATLRDLTITKGKIGTKGEQGDEVSGGGIRTEGALTLERVAVTGNTAAHEGGGITCLASCSLALRDVTVGNNKSLGDDGGGIEVDSSSATLTNTTVSKNKSGDEGGGLHVSESALTLTNCTVSGNGAKAEGGGLRIEDGSSAELTNVTIAGNKTKEGGGGIDPGPTSQPLIRNVILNKNKPVNCGGPLDLGGGNLESGDSCGLAGAESNIKKMGLAGLKSNGGATQTHALKAGSPAIDFGVDATCEAIDQRGQARVDVSEIGPRICDSGAYEFAPDDLPRGSSSSSSGIAKGDFNGDGFADLAVGVPDETTPAAAPGAGAVIVIYGSANGLTATDSAVPPAQFWSQNTPGIPGVSEGGDGFGSALASGDFNGDNFSDLAVGIPFQDGPFEDQVGGVSFDSPDKGALVVIYGSSKGLSATDSSVSPQRFDSSDFGISLGQRNELFGFSLAWGDFDGDEVGDLGIGVPGITFSGNPDANPNEGAVAVLFGSIRDGLTINRSQFLNQNSSGIQDQAERNDFFGRALTSGDFNGDAVSDLAIGVPGEDLGTRIQNEGAVAVILGLQGFGLSSLNNQLRSAVTTLPGIPRPATNDQFGLVLTAGDFNGDQVSDVAVGVPDKDVAGTDAGGVYVFMGRVGSALGGGVQFWNQDRMFVNRNPNDRLISEAGDEFGSALAAGDFDGDGHGDLAIGAPFEVVTSFRFGSSPTNIDRAGEVDVIYGSPDGLIATGRADGSGAPQSQHQDQVNIEEDAEAIDLFGSSLTAWNFGNGAQTDLAIGVPFEDVSGQQNAGAVNVLYGSSTGLTFARDQLWHQDSPGIPGGSEAGDHFGKALY